MGRLQKIEKEAVRGRDGREQLSGREGGVEVVVGLAEGEASSAVDGGSGSHHRFDALAEVNAGAAKGRKEEVSFAQWERKRKGKETYESALQRVSTARCTSLSAIGAPEPPASSSIFCHATLQRSLRTLVRSSWGINDGGAAAGEPQIELVATVGGAAKGDGAHGSLEDEEGIATGEVAEMLARGGCEGTTTSSSPPRAADPKIRDGGGGEEERVSFPLLFPPPSELFIFAVGPLDEETFEGGRPIVPPIGPGALAKARRGLVRPDEPGAARPFGRGPP